MSIISSSDLGDNLLAVIVDHDPTVVATNVPAGSLIIFAGSANWYRKLDDGSTTNVSVTVGQSGYSGYSGTSGVSGYSGTGQSGYSGYSGVSGYSGLSGYSGASGQSGYSGISGYSGVGAPLNLPALEVLRTTSYSLTTSFVDITFDTKSFANDTSIIDRDGTNTERIYFYSDGLYAIHYTAFLDLAQDIRATTRLFKNGTTAIDGSTREVNTPVQALGAVFDPTLEGFDIQTFVNGDYITLQAKVNSTGGSPSPTTQANGVILYAYKLSGLTGQSGYSGFSGATLLSGYSGFSGNSTSGYSGYSGYSGVSGYSGSGVISNNQITATADTSTTSTTYVQMSTMTTTAPSTGTFLVMFSASGNGSSTGADMTYAIFTGTTPTIIQHTERNFNFGGGSQFNAADIAMHSQVVTSLTSGDTVEIQYKTSAGTFTVHERSLILIRIA